MLPTMGLFKALPCPFYVVGLCERPNCSFRHCRSDVEAARKNSATEEEDVFGSTAAAATSGQQNSPLSYLTNPSPQEKQASSTPNTEVTRNIVGLGILKSADEQNGSLSIVTQHQEGVRQNTKRELDKPNSQTESPQKRIKLEEKSDSSEGKEKPEKTEDTSNNKTSDKQKCRERSQSSSSKSSKESSGKHHKSHKSSHKHKKSSKSVRHSKHDSSKSSSSKSTSSSSKHPKSERSSNQTSTSNSKDNLAKKNSSDMLKKNSVTRNIEKDIDTSKVPRIRTAVEDAEEIPDEFLCPSDEEDDPDQIALECYQMFQDYSTDDKSVEPLKLETVPETKVQAEIVEEIEQNSNKKRVAHFGATKSLIEKPPPIKRKETAQEQLFKRFDAVQKISATMENQCLTQVKPAVTPVSRVVPAFSGKRRIAHVTNASALMKPPTTAKPDGSSNTDTSSKSSTFQNGIKPSPVTISHTVAKGERRVAHTAASNSKSLAPTPKITPDARGKVPPLVRQKFLEQIYHECLQIYSDSETATARALEEEKTLLAKCNSKQVYTCSAINLIARLRKEYREMNADTTSPLSNNTRTVSHSEILAGKTNNVSWSIEKKAAFNPVGPQLYAKLQDYIMSTSELIDNGYPRKCPSTYKGCSGLAIIKERDVGNYSRVIEDSERKTCDRCKTKYLVDEHGYPKRTEDCTYHTGRRFGKRTRTGNAETRYSCCDGDPNSAGCCTAACHVSTGKTQEDLKSFICAALDPGDADKMGSHPWDIIGVDCEMVYTTHGSQLARATFVGVDGRVIYDTLVKPTHPVLDYNTRYSGIEESTLADTSTSIKEVQLKILANLKPNSIIVGHSLENDLIALKLIHGCVIDTSLVFPHKMGPPYKRALRNLSADYLGKIIQVGDSGHDSAEDARAALDLMLWKVKNDYQKSSRRPT